METRESPRDATASTSIALAPDPARSAVSVEDARVGDRFQLAVAPERALDAFYHPFACAA